MAIKQLDIRNTWGGSTPLNGLRGGQHARQDRVMAAFANADRVLGNGRRVLARVGLHGQLAHQVGSTTTSTAAQTYPAKATSRVVLRGKYLLTPGHFPVVSALVLPAGATQKFVVGVGWVLDVVAGWIDVTCRFDNGVVETVTYTFETPPSDLQYGGEGATDGWAWSDLRRLGPAALAPAGALQDPADIRAWAEGVTCEITIAYRGGVRCVDLVVQEQPFSYARDTATDAVTTFTIPLAVDNAGPPKEYPSAYPLVARTPTDPTFGTELLADAVDRQHSRLGPVLAQWSGWRESQAVTDTASAGVSTTSLTFVNLVDTTLTIWSAASPGWSLASGGQAQQYATSDPHRKTRGADAVVPVRCWVYGSRSGFGTAVVRFASEKYSIAEVNITDSADAWWSATGHLRCGLGPQDTSVLQTLGKLAAAGTLAVRHIVVEYLDV